ncbi:striatin-3 isoform X2 [Daktulosphaira vitifoliae]|uniref:striatin-3 isoform X2 n=1 Tax=Daktulosphaira vitifoliae TaxID=58002 RepID=UPI0021AA2824|nr:striatin-3 isoform X2 [Daktulosphaira vitifoliae]
MRGPVAPFNISPSINMMMMDDCSYNGGKQSGQQQLHQQQQQMQQQGGGGGFGQKGEDGLGGPTNKVKYTMPGVLHYIQHEWSNFELERSHWEIDRAELQARIAFLQSERKGQDNLKNDLVRRIQMLEHALRSERAKYHKLKYGTEISQTEMQLPSASSSVPDEYSTIPDVNTDSETPLSSITNVSWKQGRQLLREYLHEIGYTDTIIDVRSSRVRNLLGLNNNNNNFSGGEQGQSDNNQINGNNYNKRFSDNQGQCSPTKRQSQKKLLDAESAVMANFEFLSTMRGANESGDVDMDDDGVDDEDDDDDDDDEMGMTDDVIDMTSICKFGPDDVDAEAEEVVNELQLLTEDMSNKENDQNDWKMSNTDVFNRNTGNANWRKNKPTEMVDGNMDLSLGLGELAQLTVNNESEINVDVVDMKSASRKTWNAKYTLRSHFDGVRALAFHPTESILITASEDHTMKLWNLQKTVAPKKSASLDVEPLYTFRSHTGPVFCLAVSKNGDYCYSGGLDNVIKVWSMPSANIDPYDSYDKNILVNNLEGHEDAVWGLSVHHKRSEILSCSSDGTVKLWSPTNLKTPCLSSYVSDQDETPTSVDYVRDVEGQFVASYTSSHCVIFDIETKSPITRLECSKDPAEMATQLIHRVKCHPTLPLTITAHDDHHIRFFDNNSGKMVHSMVAHLDAVTSLAVDPNGLYLLSGSHDSSIRIWNLESKTCVQEITAHRKKLDESILDVAFHPSEAYIASAGADSLVKVFV